jgi:hypothetical protein
MENNDLIPRKCMCCDKDYNHNRTCKYSKKMKEYINYLGCCCEECFNSMPRAKRNRLILGAWVYNNKE